MAARLVWMLRATGHQAALLDGGIQAYDGPLETETAPRPAATFTVTPWPAERLASIDDAADPANVVIDARQRERYLGGPDTLDPRFGHIPGARSLPCRENLAPDGRFLPVELLREKLAEAGITGNEPVVSYCGSGVTACHNLLAIEHAGLGAGRLFPGSWSQWSRDPDRPIETT
jgi:thiosulfate/3-mercaptopyruvate sulfurtransferase